MHGFQLRKNISAGLTRHWDYGPFNFCLFCTKAVKLFLDGERSLFAQGQLWVKLSAPNRFVGLRFSFSEDGA